MVLQDIGGGNVSAVSYDSQAPLDKTLRSFAINLTNNPTFGQILNQARGEKVEAVLQQTQGGPARHHDRRHHGRREEEGSGRQGQPSRASSSISGAPKACARVRLSDVQRVRFLNPAMDGEVKKALETLALSHDTQKKAVSLAFTRRRQAHRQGRLRRREPDLEDELSPRPRQEGQAVPAGLGRRREHPGRGLDQRPHGPGQRPAHLLPDGPVSAAVRPAAGRRARTVRLAAAADLSGARWSTDQAASKAGCAGATGMRADRQTPRRCEPARRQGRPMDRGGPRAEADASRTPSTSATAASTRRRRRRSWATSSSTRSRSR